MRQIKEGLKWENGLRNWSRRGCGSQHQDKDS